MTSIIQQTLLQTRVEMRNQMAKAPALNQGRTEVSSSFQIKILVQGKNNGN